MTEIETPTATPTQDERILAALAHAGVVIPFWGLIGSIVIWATQRDKSRPVSFQALQGTAYQLTLILCGALCLVCYICSMSGTLVGPIMLIPVGLFAAESGGEFNILGLLPGVLTVLFPFLVMGVLVLAGLAYVVYGLYGAMRVPQGHDFRYIFIGRWLERYVDHEATAA